jgi:hypothetical protein
MVDHIGDWKSQNRGFMRISETDQPLSRLDFAELRWLNELFGLGLMWGQTS